MISESMNLILQIWKKKTYSLSDQAGKVNLQREQKKMVVKYQHEHTLKRYCNTIDTASGLY